MPENRPDKATDLTKSVTRDILAMLDGPPDNRKLEKALRHLSKWRAHLVENTLTSREGRQVISGPFKGMDYNIRATEGAASARLIGCYEASLSPVLKEIIARSYPSVMDIGCAEGYYAVGLALRMPGCVVMAYDTNPDAQEACAVLAKRNKVADRVQTGGTVTHSDFSRCQTEKTLIICDIEGAEDALLDPEKAPGLRTADILVEVHDCFSPGLSKTIETRFSGTHQIRRIGRTVDMSALPDWMEDFSDLDRLLALWEWRMGPTPWLWMTSTDQP